MSEGAPEAAGAARNGTVRRVTAIVAGVVAIGLVGVGVVKLVSGGDSDSPAAGAGASGTASCAAQAAPLRILANADIAPVISKVVRQGTEGTATASSSCPPPVVIPTDPDDAVSTIVGQGAGRFDVWIPDSSAWIPASMITEGKVAAQRPSIASSPYVVAAPQRAVAALRLKGDHLRMSDLLSPTEVTRLRWALPDPAASVASATAVNGMLAQLAGSPAAAASLASVVRSANVEVGTDLDDTLARTRTVPTLVPTTEQQAYLHNRTEAGSPVVVAYQQGGSIAADYPFVVLTTDAAEKSQAAKVLAQLTSGTGQRLLAEQGFRSVRGTPASVLSAEDGFDRSGIAPRVATAASMTKATKALAAVRRGSRVLAVLDISGSMSRPVPNVPGFTRMDVALQALTTGLAIYPDNTMAGLWTFSTNLTRTTDYKVLVKPVPLGVLPDGTTGRARLAQALSGVRVRKFGDTGLYDTALASVRSLRATWDPQRVSSVVLVTDGANDDKRGISLATLLRTLKAENDPKKPVTIFAIAYGPSADLGALRQIAAATGGATYAARDPRTIGTVLQNAIGHRVCPTCGS